MSDGPLSSLASTGVSKLGNSMKVPWPTSFDFSFGVNWCPIVAVVASGLFSCYEIQSSCRIPQKMWVPKKNPQPHLTSSISTISDFTKLHGPKRLLGHFGKSIFQHFFPQNIWSLQSTKKPKSQDKTMKLLSLNFLTCAIRTCKSSPSSFPLHPRDAELESVELDFSPQFLRNVLPRLEWGAMDTICKELGLRLPEGLGGTATTGDGAGGDGDGDAQEMEGVEEAVKDDAPAVVMENVTEEDLKALHRTLIETQIVSGKLVCGNCGHEYAVKEGIANFLLPAHLV